MKLLTKANHIVYIFLPILVLSYIACNETLEVESSGYIQKLVVESYINSQSDSIFLKLSKTMSPYNYILYGDTSLQAHNAEIKIILDGSEYFMTEDTIKTKVSGGYTYSINRKAGEYYLKGIKLSGVSKCSLDVSYNGMHVSSDEEFPEFVKLNSALYKIERTPSSSKSYYNTKLLLNLDANFPEGKKCHYRITSVGNYFVPSWSYYYRYEKTQYFIINSSNKNEYLEIDLGNINENWELKSIKLTVDHISEKYYNFIKALDAQYEYDESIYGSEGTLIPTNINDGYGIFTCISRDTICLDIK
jgi:hypothetical protein